MIEKLEGYKLVAKKGVTINGKSYEAGQEIPKELVKAYNPRYDEIVVQDGPRKLSFRLGQEIGVEIC